MTRRGRVLRDTNIGPGLMTVEGIQYSFVLEKMWCSEMPPRPGMSIDVTFNSDGMPETVKAISETQVAQEETQKASSGVHQSVQNGLNNLQDGRRLGIGFLVVGAVIILMHLRDGAYSILSFGMLIGLAILYVGLQLSTGKKLTDSPLSLPSAKTQNYPAGFQAAYAHKNIAIDTTTGMVWLRDRGSAVINKREVIGVHAQSDSSNHQTNIGPRTVHLHCRLIVRTRDVAKPVWTVPFNSHFSRSVTGGRANYEEAQAWEARMLAFLAAP